MKDKRIEHKFRRQHSIGGYILDFYNHDKKLIIEIDGGIHNSPGAKEYDGVRDKFFIDLGYKILRFSNDRIEKDMNEVLREIKLRLAGVWGIPSPDQGKGVRTRAGGVN